MAVLVDSTTGVVGRKVSRTVSADGSALCNVKWSPREDFDEAGSDIATATVEQKATGLEFLANATADTGISAYTGASGGAGNIVYADANANSVQEVLDIINGIGVGQPGPLETGYMIRYRAGLGDFRPGFVLGATSGLVVAAGNIMLGSPETEGLAVNGDTSGLETADLYSVGIGTDRAQAGGNAVFADHFESDYVTDTSGNRYRVRSQGRRREEQPGLSEFSVHITEVLAGMSYASDAKVVSIYDEKDNLLASYPIASGTSVPSISEATPFVGPIGSPLFIECVGSGVLTDGPFTVTGEVRVA